MRDLLGRSARRALGLLLVISALTPAGCSQPTGTVSGTVMLGKIPLPSGTITFVGTGEPHSAGIVEGKYETAAMPVGTYKVMITVRDQSPIGAASAAFPGGVTIGAGMGPADGNKSAPAPSRPSVAKSIIDPKYNDPETSGLTSTVKAGANTFDAGL